MTNQNTANLNGKKSEAPVNLVCWKVWGGNESASVDVHIPGLRGVLHATPHKAETGGDVYYMSACGSGAIARLCLADVSGHGEEASLISSWLEETFSRNIHRENPNTVLKAVNARAHAYGYDAMSTALCLSYNSLTGAIHFGNAGHPHMLLCRSGSDSWEELKPPEPTAEGIWNVPLAVKKDAKYAMGKERLHPGDRLLLYTDGVVEARDASGKQIGDDIWASVPTDGKPEVQLETLLAEYRAHIGAEEASQDDITLILLEVQPYQEGNRFYLFYRNQILPWIRRTFGIGG